MTNPTRTMLVLPLLLALAAGCRDGAAASADDARDRQLHAPAPRDGAQGGDADRAHERGAGAHKGITSGSVYNLTGAWWDASGERRPLSALAGRIRIVAMAYTHCAHACPAIIAELRRIEAEVGPEADVGFVLASFDPERDTPERLAQFAERALLEPEHWTLLGAPAGDALELAAVLGVQYRAIEGGDFAHSNVLVVLDRDGEMVHRQNGLEDDRSATVAAVRRLLAHREAGH